jgi:hypothetical protein
LRANGKRSVNAACSAEDCGWCGFTGGIGKLCVAGWLAGCAGSSAHAARTTKSAAATRFLGMIPTTHLRRSLFSLVSSIAGGCQTAMCQTSDINR